MKINGPLCLIPSHDDHWIISRFYEFMVFMKIKDDGRLVPKLKIFQKSCCWNFPCRNKPGVTLKLV